jgi:hypothetical protein
MFLYISYFKQLVYDGVFSKNSIVDQVSILAIHMPIIRTLTHEFTTT